MENDCTTPQRILESYKKIYYAVAPATKFKRASQDIAVGEQADYFCKKGCKPAAKYSEVVGVTCQYNYTCAFQSCKVCTTVFLCKSNNNTSPRCVEMNTQPVQPGETALTLSLKEQRTSIVNGDFYQ